MPLSPASADATADNFDDLRELMEEPAGGNNYGRAASVEPETFGRHLDLSVEAAQERDLLNSGGWTIVHAKQGREAGLSAHRGATHPDEHVDTYAVRVAAIERLGFTLDEIRSVYRQGRLSASQGELRAKIDARLLALSRAGGEIHRLGEVLGFPMRPSKDGGDRCEVISNALARARAAEEMAA